MLKNKIKNKNCGWHLLAASELGSRDKGILILYWSEESKIGEVQGPWETLSQIRQKDQHVSPLTTGSVLWPASPSTHTQNTVSKITHTLTCISMRGSQGD